MRTLFLLLALCALLALPARALDAADELAASLGTDALEAALPEEAEALLEDYDVRGALQPEGALRRLASAARETLFSALRGAAKSAASILAIVVLCAVGESVAAVLGPIQKEQKRLLDDRAYVDGIIRDNAQKAAWYAEKTLRKVQKKVGFPERVR